MPMLSHVAALSTKVGKLLKILSLDPDHSGV
jgi:hypothetical protein